MARLSCGGDLSPLGLPGSAPLAAVLVRLWAWRSRVELSECFSDGWMKKCSSLAVNCLARHHSLPYSESAVQWKSFLRLTYNVLVVSIAWTFWTPELALSLLLLLFLYCCGLFWDQGWALGYSISWICDFTKNKGYYSWKLGFYEK